MALAAGSRLGPYEIIGPLGAGGMGEVYKARDTRLDRDVAVKVVSGGVSDDPVQRQRFEREARTISSLDHVNICALYDLGHDSGIDYLVMQLLEGETLGARIEHGPLPLHDALSIGAQIADALAAAHRRGIVHRDLKPANVMLVRGAAGRSVAKLLDFGLAKQHAPVSSPSGMTKTMMMPLTGERSIVGTLHYMAPEQLEGGEADARTDIFALGLVLYEMVSGKRAFDGSSSASIIAAIMSAQPARLTVVAPVVPASLDRLVARCLAKSPDDRWQSAADLAWELRTIADQATRESAIDPPHASRTPVVAAAIAGAALALAVAAVLWTQLSQTPSLQEIRLALPAPEGHSIEMPTLEYDPDFAISPDGGAIAFVAMSADHRNQLWLRPFSSATARPLGGTDGARSPFWSPDAQFVGYATTEGLMRVPVAGGAPQRLSPAAGNVLLSNAAWGPSDIVMYDRTRAGELFMVPAGGGTATPVPHGTAPANAGQRYPVLLPDGRHFLFLSWAADPGQRAVYLGSLDSDERTLLVKTGFRAFYTKGHLVYVRNRVLVAQRLSLDPPQLTGDPVTLVEGIALEAIPGQALVSVSASGAIAYRARTPDLESELRWFTRDGQAGPRVAGPSTDITVSLSPDGRRALTTRLIMSTRVDERIPANIWQVELARGVSSRMTLDASATDENPIWSPDGSEFAYATHAGGALAEVRVQKAGDSSSARVVASGPDNFHPIDWSRDGRHILLQRYATAVGADDVDLWVMAVRGEGKPTPFIEGPYVQSQGQFSPDGRWVAYMSEESGRGEVYVRAFPSGAGRSQISTNGGGQPRWRADSRELFYIAPDGTIMAVPLTADRSELTADPPFALFREPSLRISNSPFYYGGAANYAVSPDGRRLLVNRLVKEPGLGPIQIVLNALQ